MGRWMSSRRAINESGKSAVADDHSERFEQIEQPLDISPNHLEETVSEDVPHSVFSQTLVQNVQNVQNSNPLGAAGSGVDLEAVFDESAATIEHDGGAPHEWAEGLARLCTMPRPAAYTQRRWEHLINDAGRFVDEWAVKASELGWTTAEIFGVDPAAPEARQDGRGLVSLLDGRRIIEMLTDRVVVVPQNGGSRLPIYRRAREGQIPVWQLER